MEYILLFSVFIILFILYVIRCSIEDKKREKRFEKSLYKDYGLASSKKYREGRFDKLAEQLLKRNDDNTIDDITWNDLDLDRIFKQIDFTLSSAGEEALYSILRQPSQSEETLKERERLIRYFMEHEEERVQLQVMYAKIGRTGKYSVYDYINYMDNITDRSNFSHITVLCLMACSLVFCLFNVALGVMAFVALFCYNLITYMKENSKNLPYITTFEYFIRMLKVVKLFEQFKFPIIQSYLDELNIRRKKFDKFLQFSWLVTNQNESGSSPLDIIVDYIKMGFHLNLIKFNQMLQEVKDKKDDMIFMIETMGYIEAMISIGCFRASLDYYTIPDFTNEKCNLEALELYHSLIENPVSNSVSLEKGMLLTGSNASGKSTFLKTIAIAQIMAQSIHTVPAKKFVTNFYKVYTSMALRDDLASADSYFIVEIKSLKRIIDEVSKKDIPVMCFVDEVLRGTNTVERIAASTEILENLANEGAFSFAATHDIELTKLLQNSYENYHFEETIQDNDVKFNYLLKEGKARSRNAIKLLTVLGYDKQITESAEKRAEQFLQNGEWH